MQPYEIQSVDAVQRAITHAFAELKRETAHLYHMISDVDLHSLEMTVTDEIFSQVEKEKQHRKFNRGSYMRESGIAEALAPTSGRFDDKNTVAKDQEIARFQKIYFQWSKGFLETIKGLKARYGWSWLDTSAVAKTLGTLEI